MGNPPDPDQDDSEFSQSDDKNVPENAQRLQRLAALRGRQHVRNWAQSLKK